MSSSSSSISSSESRKRDMNDAGVSADENFQPLKRVTRSHDDNNERIVWDANESFSRSINEVKKVALRRKNSGNNEPLIIGVYNFKGGVGKTTL
jgi:hypothetical protein